MPYKLNIKVDKLIFRTSSFRAEAGSLLHSGIYNKELTSSLAAGALTLFSFIAVYLYGVRLRPADFLYALALFSVSFVLFRRYVFFEEDLEAVIDRVKGRGTVSIKGFFRRQVSFRLDEVADISGGVTIIAPENPDGIRVVEKIALQHGQVIPGFGEVREFHTVNLELKDGRGVTLFASRDASEARAVLAGLKDFMGERFAKKV